ncbi:putative NRPS-like protein biosynthetic cluster [Diaporthe australafricana]|uniref:NRPS-like protein biosynthetic cluster n=1 Tax=Diaporthe australafricana TaxID=127596 RepID=A0ABR3XWN7_9PEZI
MMNLLVCRIWDVGSKSVQELVDTIRDDFSAALPNQSFSLRDVQRILGNSESRLFNTIVNTFYGPSKLINDSDQLIKLVSSHNASDLDIVVKAVYTDVDLRVRLAYSSTTLSPTMARHVAHAFAAILDRMVAVPEPSSSVVSEVITASPYDLEQMNLWDDRSLEAPDFQSCVHDLIQSTARSQPKLPSIHAWDGYMDYEKLDNASSALAHLIIEQNVGTGKYISLCFEKSKWYSVALLGVMKSGNAFVPLDLSNPEQRIRKILNQLKASDQQDSLIICSAKVAEKCAPLAKQIIILEQQLLDKLLSIGSTDRRLPTTNPKDPAYVIFTSGSTGEPKGVIVEHGAYSHAARAHGPNLHIDHTSRVLQFASYGFDTSIEDHLTTFVLGGCLCVPSEEDRLSIPDLAAFALQAGANWAHITPSFAETLTRRGFPTLRTMVLGGEPMTFGNIREWSKPGECRLIQVYGPSECCVTTTVNSDVAADSMPTDVGTALPGCATWVVRPNDPHKLRPVGAVGELLVEGPILARGYLNGQGLTSAAFLQDLKWAPDRRMYRTGDLVKYDSKETAKSKYTDRESSWERLRDSYFWTRTFSMR